MVGQILSTHYWRTDNIKWIPKLLYVERGIAWPKAKTSNPFYSLNFESVIRAHSFYVAVSMRHFIPLKAAGIIPQIFECTLIRQYFHRLAPYCLTVEKFSFIVILSLRCGYMLRKVAVKFPCEDRMASIYNLCECKLLPSGHEITSSRLLIVALDFCYIAATKSEFSSPWIPSPCCSGLNGSSGCSWFPITNNEKRPASVTISSYMLRHFRFCLQNFPKNLPVSR